MFLIMYIWMKNLYACIFSTYNARVPSNINSPLQSVSRSSWASECRSDSLGKNKKHKNFFPHKET